MKAAYVQEHMNSDGTMTSDFQGVYILALATETIPESLKKKSIACLKELIVNNGDCLDTDFLSVSCLMPVLQKLGELELAHRLLFQDKCPSWLYEIKMGATTIWEVWDAYSENGVP